jgi:hypothetical protein
VSRLSFCKESVRIQSVIIRHYIILHLNEHQKCAKHARYGRILYGMTNATHTTTRTYSLQNDKRNIHTTRTDSLQNDKRNTHTTRTDSLQNDKRNTHTIRTDSLQTDKRDTRWIGANDLNGQTLSKNIKRADEMFIGSFLIIINH